MSNSTDNDTGNKAEAGSQSQMTNVVEENETEVKPRSRKRPVVAKSSLTARELSATELPVDESTCVIARAARKKAKNTTSNSGRTESRKGTDSGTNPRKSKSNKKLNFTMTTQEPSATEVQTAALAENPIEVLASATIAVEIQVPTTEQALKPTSDISKLLAAMAEPGADLTSLMQQIAAVRNVHMVVAKATPAGSDA